MVNLLQQSFHALYLGLQFRKPRILGRMDTGMPGPGRCYVNRLERLELCLGLRMSLRLSLRVKLGLNLSLELWLGLCLRLRLRLRLRLWLVLHLGRHMGLRLVMGLVRIGLGIMLLRFLL